MIDLERKRQRIELAVKLVAIPVVGFVLAPFVFVAIKGLIGAIVAGVISLIAINLAPWAGAKIANWRLKALKHEAAKNPIETLENQYQEKELARDRFKAHITEFYAQIQNFHAEIEEHKSKFPDQPCKFEPQYQKMLLLLENRTAKFRQVQANLLKFADVIEQKRSEWKVAQAAAKMSKAAGVGEDFVSKLMQDTAIDSVQTSLNTAFAELETSLLDEVVAVEAPQPSVVVAVLPERSSTLPALDLDFVSDSEKEPARKRKERAA